MKFRRRRLILATIFGFCILQSFSQIKEIPNIVEIDKTILFNQIFKDFNLQKDFLNFNEKYTKDSLMKKTSNIIYKSRKDENLEFAKMNNCRSEIENGNLKIRVGLFNGIGGSGFLIYLKKNKYIIKPYLSFCTPHNRKQKLRIISQSLILNNDEFIVGDSIYGKIKFKIIEKDIYGTNEHNADGYFRSKIK